VRIDRDTVSTQTWTWQKAHEAERLGCRCIDNFPYIDGEFFTNNGDFVHQADVDGTERVLQQLGHLSDTWGGDGQDFLDGCSIIGPCEFRTGRCNAANNFGCVARVEVGIAGIDTLW